LCAENPSAKVKPVEKLRKKPVSFTLREIDLIFKFAPKHKSGNLVLALLHTAMREGELSALIWPHVHADESYIEICRTVAEVENDDKTTIIVGGKEKHKRNTTSKKSQRKSRQGIRSYARSSSVFLSLPNYKKGLYVFPAISGSFMTPNQFREQYGQFFKALNKALDIDKAEYIKAHPNAKQDDLVQFEHVRLLSPHKCRHTYATHAIRSGINI